VVFLIKLDLTFLRQSAQLEGFKAHKVGPKLGT
jgi:hypothetical protein